MLREDGDYQGPGGLSPSLPISLYPPLALSRVITCFCQATKTDRNDYKSRATQLPLAQNLAQWVLFFLIWKNNLLIYLLQHRLSKKNVSASIRNFQHLMHLHVKTAVKMHQLPE